MLLIIPCVTKIQLLQLFTFTVMLTSRLKCVTFSCLTAALTTRHRRRFHGRRTHSNRLDTFTASYFRPHPWVQFTDCAHVVHPLFRPLRCSGDVGVVPQILITVQPLLASVAVGNYISAVWPCVLVQHVLCPVGGVSAVSGWDPTAGPANIRDHCLVLLHTHTYIYVTASPTFIYIYTWMMM